MNTSKSIVIGGGLAGLAAATYLARGGASVTLLEKSHTLGGRANTEHAQGFAFNRGAHALYTGGSASAVLRDLGVTYTGGAPSRLCVSDERGLHAFPSTPMSLLRTNLLDAADKAELMRLFMVIGSAQPAALGHTTAEAWLRKHAHRPRVYQLLASVARVYLYTAALDLASADTFVARFQQSLKHPIHYIDGGWQTLVEGARAAALKAGVDIRTSASVAELQLRGAYATGVRLHDGATLLADSVIIATPPEDAFRLAPPKGNVQLTPLHIACLDVALTRLPEPSRPVVFDTRQPRFLTTQSEFSRLGPEGGALIQTFLQLDPRVQLEAHEVRANLEGWLDEIQPGWRDVLVERRFLPRILAVGAMPLAAQGGLAGRPGYRASNLDNVYFAGDWVGPTGFLVDASLDSARAAARLVLERQPQLLAA